MAGGTGGKKKAQRSARHYQYAQRKEGTPESMDFGQDRDPDTGRFKTGHSAQHYYNMRSRNLKRFHPRYVEQAEKLYKMGFTDAEFAEFIGASLSSVRMWRAKYPKFRKASEVGKDEADDRVARSFYMRATGYEHPTERIFHNRGEVVRAETLEHVPPDVQAGFLWLKNRRPDEWKDRSEQHITGAVAHLTDEEIDARLSKLLGKTRNGDAPGRAGEEIEEAEIIELQALPEAEGVPREGE